MSASTLVIPETDSTEGYERPIATATEGVGAAGFYPQNATSSDLLAGIERDASGNLVFKDPVATVTLAQLAKIYDFLLDNEPVGVGMTYAITRTSGFVTNETWTITATSKTLKTIDYTRSSNLVTVEVRKVFAADGITIVAQITETYARASGLVTGSTITRDV